MASQTSSTAANGKSAVIESGHGGDLLVGEAGVDVFHIASVEASAKTDQDTIEGFGAGDLISFSGIALKGAGAPTTLHWAGVEPDSGKAYGVWQWADGTLRADINGDSMADISVDMQGHMLTAADLNLGQTAPPVAQPPVVTPPVVQPPVVTPPVVTPPASSDNGAAPSFHVDHAQGTLVDQHGSPIQGLTARITTPDDIATQTALNPEFYKAAAALGADMIRLDVVGAVEGRTVEQQVPLIQQAIAAAKAAGLGVQLEFSQNSVSFDRAEATHAWSILAPMFANDPSVTYEEANEPGWPVYNDALLDDLAAVYHVMRDAAPNKPIAVLDFPVIDSVDSALSNIHGMEARGVDFSDQTLVAWHGYSAYGDSAGLALRDAGYAAVMTEITDYMSPYILADAYKAGISAFDLAGGFGVTNPDPAGDPVGAYLDTFINYTNPALLQAGVDWQANGVAAPSTSPVVVTPPVVTPPVVTPPVVTPPVVTPPSSTPPETGAAHMIESGQGANVLTGTNAADVFHIGSISASPTGAADTIASFGAGDKVSFAGISLTGAGHPDMLHWAGVEPSAGKAYGVWQWADGTLRADVTGDSMADISIDMRGHMLGAGDFVFGDGSSQPVVTVPVVDPPVVQPPVVTQPPAGTADLPVVTTVWSESFDHGLGALSRAWGPGIDLSIPGQLTIHSTPDNQDSGAMVPPVGAAAGNGYGLYSFTISMGQGDVPGAYALLWPATDVWPGPELDMIELAPGGDAYSTMHYKAADGSNGYDVYSLGGVDVKQAHTYAMLWEEGRLTGFVDGQKAWTTTDHVPADYAHGGENSAPGIGMQTWWSADLQHGSGYDNAITLYDMSYAVVA